MRGEWSFCLHWTEVRGESSFCWIFDHHYLNFLFINKYDSLRWEVIVHQWNCWLSLLKLIALHDILSIKINVIFEVLQKHAVLFQWANTIYANPTNLHGSLPIFLSLLPPTDFRCFPAHLCYIFNVPRGRRDHMVVGVTTTCAIVVSLNHAHGEVYSIQHYVIKFVSHLWQLGGFLRVLWFQQPIKLTTAM